MKVDRATVSMEKEILKAARKKARSLRLSFSKYVETVIARDVEKGGTNLVLEPKGK